MAFLSREYKVLAVYSVAVFALLSVGLSWIAGLWFVLGAFLSLFAGFMGALASQFWFLAFAITSPARVRTLALVEVPFAQIVSRRIFKERMTKAEISGMALIVLGVILLLNG